MRRSDFTEILKKVERREPAELVFEADGTAYTRHFYPRERLIVLGGGHIAQPLCRFATAVGFSVTVVDDRDVFAAKERFPEADETVCGEFGAVIRALDLNEFDYTAIVTRGHRCDTDCLRAILDGTLPRYVGMIGSRKRTRDILDMLEGEGTPRTVLDQIHTPIGIDIGALTIEEIAVSIVAQLIQCRRSTVSRSKRSGILLSEEVHMPLLRFVTEEKPQALMIVLETSGSTPAKSGAMMVIDENRKTAGTIGGGLGEHEIMEAAYSLIGTGRDGIVRVDMTHDVAADEGMVCGGNLTAYVADLQK